MEKIKLHCAELNIQDEHIIRVKLFDDIDFIKKDAETLLNAITKLTAGKKYYLLTITNDNFTATPEVREYVAKNISSTGILANAICIKSLPIRLIINAYVKFNNPSIPTKTFNTESVALEWIEDIRNSKGDNNITDVNDSKRLMY